LHGAREARTQWTRSWSSMEDCGSLQKPPHLGTRSKLSRYRRGLAMSAIDGQLTGKRRKFLHRCNEFFSVATWQIRAANRVLHQRIAGKQFVANSETNTAFGVAWCRHPLDPEGSGFEILRKSGNVLRQNRNLNWIWCLEHHAIQIRPLHQPFVRFVQVERSGIVLLQRRYSPNVIKVSVC